MTEKSLDEVLESFPVSFFHYRLIIMCGLGFMADAMEVGLLSYMSACAGDEWNLTDGQKASIVGVVFAGELAGSLFWGPVADKYGRRMAYLVACVMISGGGFLSALSPSFAWLMFFRAIVGFGVGGLSVPFDMLAEFLPSSHRGPYLVRIQYFWTLGSLFVSGIAWLTIQSYGWRFLTYMTAIPVTLASIISLVYLPESPRWLLIKGKVSAAEKVVKETAAMCGVNVDNVILTFNENEVSTKDADYLDLFRTADIRWISLPLGSIWMLFGFTYYGMILYISRIYSVDSSSENDESTCQFNYEAIFINASGEFLGVFIAAFMIDPLGRGRTQAWMYVLGGVAIGLMGINVSAAVLTFLGIIGRLAIMGASCATWVATPELFPTEIRATGHSMCNSCARVGGFCSPYFVMNSSVSVVMVGVVLGAFNVLAALCAYILPETAGLTLDKEPNIAHPPHHNSKESLLTVLRLSSDRPTSDEKKLSSMLLLNNPTGSSPLHETRI